MSTKSCVGRNEFSSVATLAHGLFGPSLYLRQCTECRAQLASIAGVNNRNLISSI